MKNPHLKYGTLALLLAATLSACGGGGGSPGATGGSGSGGSGTTTPAAPTVGVTLVGANGQASSALSGATPLTVRAVVRNAANQPVPNAVVTFTTDATLAVFAPTAGTALTDASGAASITMRAASLAAGGAGSVTATAALPGTTATTASGSANYSVNATALSFSAVRLDSANIDAYGSTLVAVDLMANGAKYSGQQVNVSFSSACVTAGKATLAPSVATNMGTAQTVYRDQGCGNDDVITVSADGVATPASASLAIAPPSAASVQFVEAIPNDKSIVIQGQGGINRTETATLRFRVFDVFGRPLAGKPVEFIMIPEGAAKLNKMGDSTDQAGEVITTVNSGSVPTSFRVQAVLPGTATATRPVISTTSDSIVVTTGLPVQRAFSLSATKANVDGTYDSGTSAPASVVNILMADQFGNPVSDGTPVVFQTNIGAIGSSDRGGCLTVNGGCSVDFRVQNPRTALPNLPATPCNTGTAAGVSADSTRKGVATICASTTDGTNTQFDKITITLSDDEIGRVYIDGGTTPVTSGTVDLGNAPSADPKIFTMQLTDLNGNPLPVDSTVAITGLVGATLVELTPAKVQNIFAVAGNGPNGSSHRVTLSAPTKPCTAPSRATFNVTATTPNGQISSIPFTLNFTCP